MIISVDGNVFVGKTFAIKEIASRYSLEIVPEYSDFVSEQTEFKFTKSFLKENQERYLKAEKIRSSLISSCNDYMLDRSFLSLAAHVFGIYLIYGIDIRSWFIRSLLTEVKSGSVIIPDIFVHIVSEYSVIKNRYVEDLGKKGTLPIYIKDKYLSAIDLFLSLWQSEVPCLKCTSREFIELFPKILKDFTIRRFDKGRFEDVINKLYKRSENVRLS